MEQCAERPPHREAHKDSSHTSSQASELLAITAGAVNGLGYTHDSNCSISSGLASDHPVQQPVTNGVDQSNNRREAMYVRTFSQRVTSSVSGNELEELNQSNQSQSSVASSALLNGTAQKVKISSKKLKQIKSPFEVSVPAVEAHDINNMSLASESMMSQETKVNGSKKMDVLVEKHRSNMGDKTHPNMTRTGNKSGNFSKEIVGTITDSGYATHNVQVIHEIEGEQVSQNTSNEEVQSLNNYTLESTHDKVIQAIHHEGDSQNSSCTQPEIVTVENGVAVSEKSSGHGSGTGSQNSDIESQEMGESNNYLGDRFSRFQPALLKQGSLESGCSIGSSTGKKDQIQIQNFSLDEKQKMMRQQFQKRQQQGPTKKVIKPRIVSTERQKTPAESQTKQEVRVSNMQDAVETAAVVAASAVAATQPFLKAQQDVESKMAMILQKLAAQEGGDKTAVYKDVLDDKAQVKIEELERQLNGITQKRLDYLEKLQEQQMAWQAQLISVSQGHSPPGQQQQQPLHSVLKTKQVHHVDRPPPNTSYSPTDTATMTRPLYGEDIQKEKAVLHTPAPRTRPPQPTSMYKELSTPPTRVAAPQTGGFLAHILAQQDETPKHSPFPRTPVRSPQRMKNESSPTLKKAHHLLNELTGLNEEVQHAVVSGGDQPVHKTITGPAPLDQYMSKVVDIPPSSPYPSRADVETGDAPVSNNYAEAQATLKEVKKTQGLFEANVQAILRARQQSEVYATLDQLTYGSAPERLRIRKMVDEHILGMSSDMEREIMEELLRIEEKKKQPIMIPERDTTTTRGGNKWGQRGKTGARVDTGLKRGRAGVERGPSKAWTAGKENKPLTTTKPKAPKLETASRKSLYGKAAHEGQRTTQKHPYLRYKNLPTPKKQPPPQVKTVRGVPVATAKTQTKVSAAKQPVYYYEEKRGPTVASQPSQPQQSVGGIPAAIPLGVPRRVGSIPLPPNSLKQLAPSPIGPLHRPPAAASTPLVGGAQRGNVGMIEVKEDFTEEESVEEEEKARQIQLSKQILPSVNIDMQPPKSPQRVNGTVAKTVGVKEQSPTREKESTGSVIPTSARRLETPRTPKSLQKFVGDTKKEVQEALEEAQYLEDTFEDEGSEGIALPGYQRPAIKEYLGPEFPPQLAPRPELDPASDVIAADIRRRDLLSNKAVSWVEQELMARVISEMSGKRGAMASRRPETVSHTTPVPKRTKKVKYKDDVETVSIASDSASQHDSLIAEALGQEGFQLFINAGQEVDENLVSALIKEVLVEKVQSTVGQRTSREDEGMQYSGARRSKKTERVATATTTPRAEARSNTVQAQGSATTVKRVASPPVQIPDTPVPTPEPTPKGSPHATSPPRYRVGTPPETPEFTPEPSLAEERPVVRQPVIQPVYYSEEEEESAQPQQYRQDTVPKAAMDQPIQHQHDVDTPVNTPPPSPAQVSARTPSPSQQDEYTPIPSEMEESPRQPTPPATPPIQKTIHPEVVRQKTPPTVEPMRELNERGQQYSPPPPPSSQEDEEVTDTETTSWNTASDTNHDPISEGQWLISQNSEGEIHNGQTELRKRVKQKMIQGNLQLSQEDTLNEALDLDQDTMNVSHSEGEILDGNKPVMNEPYLMMLANMKPHKYGLPYTGHHHHHQQQQQQPKLRRDLSLGEVGDYFQQTEQGYGKKSRGRVLKVTQQALADDLQSPGELLNGFQPPLQEKKWAREEEEPVHSPEDVESPPAEVPPTLRTITVRPTTPEEPQQKHTAASSKQGAGYQGTNGSSSRQGAGSPGARRFTSQPSSGMSRPRGRDNMGGPGGRSLSPGLRPQVSAGGRPPSPDKRLQRREEGRRSYEGLYGTMSEKDSLTTMTPDQMNVDVLLNSQDYFGNTQSELMTTDDLQQYTGEYQHEHQGQHTMTRSFEHSQEIDIVVKNRQSYDLSERSYRTGDSLELDEGRHHLKLRLVETPGSTSDMSLPEGLTQTLEREESEKLSFTVDSESDLKMSGKYQDSLEGTGNGHSSDKLMKRGDGGSTTGTQQVFFTIPSVVEEDEASEDNDMSHLSLT